MTSRVLSFAAAIALASPALALELRKGDHVSIIGNALGERMQHFGWLETLLHSRFPRHELVVRNLAYTGDELVTRLRSANFGSPDEHLAIHRTDVLLAFFGYNESHAGQAGLARFERDLERFLRHCQGQKYNGESAPRMVLFSPAAHEDLRNRNLPDGSATNANLELYTPAMARVAAACGAEFVDLFRPSLGLYARAARPLTTNGIHFTADGDRELAGVIDTALFGSPGPARESRYLETLRAAVLDKCFYWFHRYRTTDGYSIYGGRADLKFVDGQTNRVVAQREMEVLDVMTQNRDRRIWAAAEGREVAADDSNTPEFIPVKTNYPGKGPNGEHIFLSGEEAIAKMTVHPGMKVSLFASEAEFPELAKPVQMAFDPRGRLWVAVMPSYPHWKPKDPMNDKILIFEDIDGDGRADKCKTFVDRIHVPTGLELWGGGVIVGLAPYLVFFKDTDGDDVADHREILLGGIDSADTHHAANSFVVDPGGALYFQEGTFHHTQIETIHGPPERCANGGVFRFEPRTHKLDVYVTYGFANPHGHVFGRWGQDFVTDGTGNVNYYAAAFSGRLDYPRKHSGLEPFFPQRERPCPATEILSSRHFPDDMQGNYLVENVIGFHGIMRYRVEDKDSGYTAEEMEPIVRSADLNFRPVDLEMGPDGAIWFIDWQNPIIGHMQHNLRDPSRDQKHGRIYRVTCDDRPLLKPFAIAGEPIPRLLDALREPEDRVRSRARAELSARDSGEVIAAAGARVQALVSGASQGADREHELLELLWLHQSHNVVDERLLDRLLASEDFRARAAATRVLCYWRDRVQDPIGRLRKLAEDPYPRVRLEAVRAASFFREARAAEAALAALKRPLDYYLQYTLKETLTQLEPHWKQAVREDARFAADNPAAVGYVLQNAATAELLRMPRTGAVLQAILARDDIVHEQRHAALEALARINGTDALAELLSLVERLDAASGGEAGRVLSDLAHMLSTQPASKLRSVKDRLARLSRDGTRGFTRQISTVALAVAAGSMAGLWEDARRSPASLRDLLDAVPLLPDARLRAEVHPHVRALAEGIPADLDALWSDARGAPGRYVRISLPRRGTLTLAEVEVLAGGRNLAGDGTATQSSDAHGGPASRAIDGNKSGRYGDGGQTHTRENQRSPWWELDLRADRAIESIVVWNRTDGDLGKRLEGFDLDVLDSNRKPVFSAPGNAAPAEKASFTLTGDPRGAVRRSAMNALVATGRDEEESFRLLASMARAGDERAAALRALGRIPRPRWPQAEAKPLVDALIAHLEALPAAERTGAEARDAWQIAGDLSALLDAAAAQSARARLQELGVPIITIRPVPHLMVYDRTHLYVEAGKAIEIVFENTDIMPHNFLLTRPGAMEKVALEAERMAADPGAFAAGFVPKLAEVLQATPLVGPQDSARLNFEAPREPGDYPYVCTFPGHWRRMNGVLHVVKSLADVPPETLAAAAATQAPVRALVKTWTLEDLSPQLEHLDHGRNLPRGMQLFTELGCNACHRMDGAGGLVGPDLALLREKLKLGKADALAILTELVEPSKVIEDKFRSSVLVLADGQLVSGIVVEETEKEIKIRTNPLDEKGSQADDVRVFQRSQVAEVSKSEVSLMPAGLLNTCTEAEILDLVRYVMGE